MAVTVKLKFVRHSARKLAPVTRQVAGKMLGDALNSTAVMPQNSALFVRKALKMAEAAAKQKEFNPDDLVVAEIFAVQGPKIRRHRANARGRANKYEKHLAHIVVSVDTKKIEKPKVKEVTSNKKAEDKVVKNTEAKKDNK